MSVTFLIPGPLRQFTGGRQQVVVAGTFTTLRDAFAVLSALHPGLRDRVLTEQGDIRQHVNLFIGNDCVRYGNGLETSVPDGSEISIVPAVSGGRVTA
jgi:sulfur-carrier protein